jgi:uncharacterized protein
MRRLTGTHVYSYVKCPRLAALDLHTPRSERRAPHAWEEFAARRGRDFETVYVAGLDAVAPAYPERDFDAGAAATIELLRQGVPCIHQAVLADDDRLGLPDLLRKVPGVSDLGDHHYEVIDVKTSGRSRSDQILQVVFYSDLLATVQGRMPEHGALVLKDGHEERFAVADFLAAEHEVLAELRRLREAPEQARPFLQSACASCYHDHRCLPELERSDDLSLVHGMSHGAQSILEGLGCRTVRELAVFHPEGARARGNLDGALLRRLRRGAQARLLGAPIIEPRPLAVMDPAAIVHLLADPFADRVLAFGMLHPATEQGVFTWVAAQSADDEWRQFRALVADLPPRTNLLHFGEALPRWHEQHAFTREADPALEARFVDLGKRLRTAAIYPAPTFGLADLVRSGLGRDPLRAGHAGEAAIWATLPDGMSRLQAKLQSDLQDLAALKAAIVDAAPSASRPAAAAAEQAGEAPC